MKTRFLLFCVMMATCVCAVSASGIFGDTFPVLGKIVTKSVKETKNDLTIGCEVLDRDYTDYQSYKEYLSPLGMRKMRLQAGWAKTEKTKGKYDFSWLDSIVDDALARGMKVWLEVSYGNPLYKGGGTKYLKGGWPVSEQGKKAWDRWVEALARHYKGRVEEWEIWNEPDVNREMGKDHKSIAELNIRTAEIIKKVDPDARIAALALALIKDTSLADSCMAEFKRRGKLGLFDWVSYHQYVYRPEDMYPMADNLRKVIAKDSPDIKIWQGESGAPSRGRMGGALGGYDWTEVSQGKWALRRILGDHARDIATGIFCISDMNYSADDGIKRKNVKGLLESGDDRKIVRAKKSYYAVSNLVSLFDLLSRRLDNDRVKVGGDKPCSAYLYETGSDGSHVVLLWHDAEIPRNDNCPVPTEIRVKDGGFTNPVLIDVFSGSVSAIPEGKMHRDGNDFIFFDVPVYDSPLMITDIDNVRVAE